MVSPENPLVPRVFVNRVWQWHFGEGIVRSVDDFGTQGAKPTHPELLDYLTVSFEEHNWDLKWLTKEIMMSQVYRQGSAEVPRVSGRRSRPTSCCGGKRRCGWKRRPSAIPC